MVQENNNTMKRYILLLSILFVSISCSKTNDIDNFVEKKWEECKDKRDCIVDFTTFLDFDTMFYFGHLSLDKMNSALGTNLPNFEDIGEYVVFVKDSKVIYSKGWFQDPEEKEEGIVIPRDTNLLKYYPNNAKFKIIKNEKTYWLVQLGDSVTYRKIKDQISGNISNHNF